MWTTLALMSALSWTPAQADQLELKNARLTYGILGQERKDTNYLPGDMVLLAFDIVGLPVGEKGQVEYTSSVTLYDHKQKKDVFKKLPQRMSVVNTLGSSRVPVFALTNIGTDTPPGTYTMTVVVTDGTGKLSKKLERQFEVVTPTFGIVRAGLTYNLSSDEQAGAPAIVYAPPVAVPGQNLMLHFTVVDFALAGDKQQPKVSVEMKVLDESGQPVLKKPFGGKSTSISDEAKQLKVIPFHIPIQVNRSGKFKIVITATDENNNNKTVRQTLDLKVVEIN